MGDMVTRYIDSLYELIIALALLSPTPHDVRFSNNTCVTDKQTHRTQGGQKANITYWLTSCTYLYADDDLGERMSRHTDEFCSAVQTSLEMHQSSLRQLLMTPSTAADDDNTTPWVCNSGSSNNSTSVLVATAARFCVTDAAAAVLCDEDTSQIQNGRELRVTKLVNSH